MHFPSQNSYLEKNTLKKRSKKFIHDLYELVFWGFALNKVLKLQMKPESFSTKPKLSITVTKFPKSLIIIQEQSSNLMMEEQGKPDFLIRLNFQKSFNVHRKTLVHSTGSNLVLFFYLSTYIIQPLYIAVKFKVQQKVKTLKTFSISRKNRYIIHKLFPHF